LTELFLDSSYVIALVNKRDQHHAQALKMARRLGSPPLVTTDAILLEVGNGLARGFKAEAIAVIEEFLSSDEVRIVSVDTVLFQQGFNLYKSHQDKVWGLVDCISFIVMREHGITDALTSDTHFEQAGFNVLLKP
jgi:predicted nucleic acid-binding protein